VISRIISSDHFITEHFSSHQRVVCLRQLWRQYDRVTRDVLEAVARRDPSKRVVNQAVRLLLLLALVQNKVLDDRVKVNFRYLHSKLLLREAVGMLLSLLLENSLD
jgi:hypothetical protein